MCIHREFFRSPQWCWVTAITLMAALANGVHADGPVVPGTGILIRGVGDDMEDPSWSFQPYSPKSSRNMDERENGPLARSSNGRWLEGPHRGTPDLLERIPTPAGGLEGSKGSLLIRTRHPGVPGKTSNQSQQDDIMVNVHKRLGRTISVDELPNCVVRVYAPPFEQWEPRNGGTFGFRIDVWGSKPGKSEVEQYWPGIFINYRDARSSRDRKPHAYMSVRGDALGHDIPGPEVQPGWYTMGMSVSADGMCHFYAKEGLDDLTEDDHLASYFCYGYRARRMDLFFFNILTMDDGKTWSTPWIIDDPKFFAAHDIPLPAKTRHPGSSRTARKANSQPARGSMFRARR
jgi:hypothetical protein